ncbi:MAG: SPOR domain-containing protein [Peptococcaceae bacterium]
MRKFFTLMIISVCILVTSVLFGQLLGGFYIYNLLVGDNPAVKEQEVKVQAPVPPPSPGPKRKVLRLEPVPFFTLQAGIYSEIKPAQDSTDKLVEMGFRPFISPEKPYKIWVGCFNDNSSGRELELFLQKSGFDAFISEGLVNDRALKFPSSDRYMQDSFSPLLGVFDITINHSLKMFKSPKISVYNAELWVNMIKKVQSELNNSIKAIDDILKLEESEKYEKNLKLLQEKAKAYQNSLDIILQAKTDKAVLYSQSYLLEVIAEYHNLITGANEQLGTD